MIHNHKSYHEHIYQSTDFQEFYEPWGITYKGLRLLDVPQTNIALHFNDITEFIDAALTGGGKVLVNCEMGMSRSSTCVLAYLMLKHKMTAGDALAKVDFHCQSIQPKQGSYLCRFGSTGMCGQTRGSYASCMSWTQGWREKD